MSMIDNINKRLLETKVVNFIGYKVQIKRSQTTYNKYCLNSEHGGEYATGSYNSITKRAWEIIERAREHADSFTVTVRKRELLVLLRYSTLLARRVAPSQLAFHDGMIGELYNHLANDVAELGEIDFKDSLYQSLIKRMTETVAKEF